ncbi:hypothetical protein HDU83_004095 [Entophlyctis luteolus]|nr:hypothetical protein HDU83_004095 [Entophlyctis luteolus]
MALITGGTDHTLWLWNLHHLCNPMASFKGHNTPIIDLAVNEAHGQVISRPPLLGDLHVQFWDIRKQTYLQTISNAESVQSPNDTLNRILFLPASLTMFAMAQNIWHYKLKKRDDAPAGAAASGTHAHSGAQIAPGKLVP